jgi:hypothetical protein
VPVPESVSDRWAQEWIDEVKRVIVEALEVLKSEQEAASVAASRGGGGNQ